MNNIIEVNGLCKRYKSYGRGSSFAETTRSLFVRRAVYVDAVSDISFGVEEGGLLGFIGPNGAGKSTTLKILTGIMYPSAGEVNVLGYTPWRDRRRYVREIGAVFGQKSQLMWDIPPLDAFLLNRTIYNIPRDKFDERLGEMSDILSVSDIIKKPTRQLSLGERMKCEFIMAMLHGPRIVFLDEPTIGLDVVAKDKIRQFIKSMNEKGTTFILTTHDIGDIECLARRVVVINHGRIVFDGGLGELKGRTGNKVSVTLTVKSPFDREPMEGVAEAAYKTDRDAEFLIDTEKISVADFITVMNGRFGISDMSVTRRPIEGTVKELYTM